MMKKIEIYRRDGLDKELEKKKSSYDAKKEKLINIKEQLESYYAIYEPVNLYVMDPKTLHARALVMQLTLDLIWEIVKDEKAK